MELRELTTPARTPGIAEGLSVVVAAPAPLAAKLSDGLTGLGAAVAVLGEPDAVPDGARAIPGPVSTRAEAIAALSTAIDLLGGFDGLIHAPGPRMLSETSFVGTDEQTWIRVAEEPIWQALVLFQAAYARFGDGSGSIVAMVPSGALTGAAGFVAFSAAAEGIRQLVKSAARAWGRSGTRVNCLTLPIEEWGISPDPGHAVPNRYGPSLAGENSGAEVAGAAALLLHPTAGAVTGATVGVDRGTVLAP